MNVCLVAGGNRLFFGHEAPPSTVLFCPAEKAILASILLIEIPQTPMNLPRASLSVAKRAQFPCLRGFSLVEMLVAISVLGILAVFTTPAFQVLTKSRTMAQGAYDIAGLLELARNEAVARQTYVWVGFQSIDTATGREIHAAAVYSLDGSGTNTNADNLSALSRVVKIRGAALGEWSSLKSDTRNLLPSSVATASVATNSAGITFDVGRTSFQNRLSLTFTPRGEALLQGVVGPNDGYDRLIDISIREIHGSTVPPSADDAALIVEGSTGSVGILRLQ
jgi:prepilin-type N-terminal cleavage/methylation domain-containing protein